MVLKKSPPKHHERSPRNKPQQPHTVVPPIGLDEAISVSELLQRGTGGSELPATVLSCLEELGTREHPKRLATLQADKVGALIEAHAKRMAEKCAKCADLLRAKYTMLEEAKLGSKLANGPTVDDASLALLRITRKSPRCVWMQPQQQPVAFAELFASAMTTSKPWPAPLELDLVNAACSRELQLHYKDDRERLLITDLHAKAQDVINQVNDYSMELLRQHFTSMEERGEVQTLSQLATEHSALGNAPKDSQTAVLAAMHAALVSSTDPQGPVQSFYPLTPDEQEQLACAVRYVQEANTFPIAQSGLYMWMVRQRRAPPAAR